MSPQPDLSIILLAYKEAALIGTSLETLASHLDTHDYGQVEVLVVVADSPDDTVAIARRKASLFRDFRVVQPGPRVGKGRDTRVGMFEARGRYRLFMDVDLATPLRHLDDVKAFMDHGGEVGIAVRDLLLIHKGLLRKVISSAANLAAQLFVAPGIKDTQCGFKVFEASAAEAIFGRITMLKWSFDMEVLAIARQLGYKIETFQAPDWRDPKPAGQGLVGDSQISIVLNGFMDPLKIRLNLIRDRYRKAHYQHQSS